MKIFLRFVSLVFVTSSAFAVDHFGMPAADLRPGEFVDGKIFSVKYVPGAKETSFYIVGKEAAQIKFDRLKIQLIVDPNGASKAFVLKRNKDAYVFDQKMTHDSRLEIQSEDGQVEQMRIRSKP